jgi:hypothetical protein
MLKGLPAMTLFSLLFSAAATPAERIPAPASTDCCINFLLCIELVVVFGAVS